MMRICDKMNVLKSRRLDEFLYIHGRHPLIQYILIWSREEEDILLVTYRMQCAYIERIIRKDEQQKIVPNYIE